MWAPTTEKKKQYDSEVQLEQLFYVKLRWQLTTLYGMLHTKVTQSFKIR